MFVSQKRLRIVIALFTMLVFIFMAFYVVRIVVGKHRHNAFISKISINMDREQVHRIAEDISYHLFESEIVDKGRVKGTNSNTPDQLVDVYYFRNVMLDSVVAVYYDKVGKVKKILSD